MNARRFVILAGVALLAPAPAASAQGALPGETRVTVADGLVLGLSMTGVSSTAPLAARVQVHDGEVYRLIVDAAGRARFAYAIRVDPAGFGIEVVFRPVRLHEAIRAFAPRQATYDLPFRLESGLVTLPDLQRSGSLGAGDSVALDLFDNRDTGQRVGDQVRVIAVAPAAVAQLAETRRAALEARPTLTIAGLTIRRGGEVIARHGAGTLATGHVVGMALEPRVGAVILSSDPPRDAPDGVAVIDGQTLRFTLDDQEYEASATEPIGPPGLTSVWIYVIREPPPFGAFHVVASDTVEGIMKMWRPRTP